MVEDSSALAKSLLIPVALRCATCNKLAFDPVKLPCCAQSICQLCRSRVESDYCPLRKRAVHLTVRAKTDRDLQTAVNTFLHCLCDASRQGGSSFTTRVNARLHQVQVALSSSVSSKHPFASAFVGPLATVPSADYLYRKFSGLDLEDLPAAKTRKATCTAPMVDQQAQAVTSAMRTPVQHGRALFGLPQELQDIIFDLAYPRTDCVKYKGRRSWESHERARRRSNRAAYVAKPFPGPKASEWLVNKRFFQSAARA